MSNFYILEPSSKVEFTDEDYILHFNYFNVFV